MKEGYMVSEQEENLIYMCMTIRRLSALDKLILDLSDCEDGGITHLFDFLDYCGVEKYTFVKNYLMNLQPYMLSGKIKQGKTDNIICVLDNIYNVSLYVKLVMISKNEMASRLIVSFHEKNIKEVTKNNSLLLAKTSSKIKVITDSITGGIANTNIKTFNLLVSRGLINVPISLVGELQLDDTFLVDRNAIDNAILNICNEYIRDLYTSNLSFPALDKVEMFSFLQQISFTSDGNIIFSNISLLIDNMSAQNSPIHKKGAGFVLETYIEHLVLTIGQKKELISLIKDKYSNSALKDICKVTNLLVAVIEKLDTDIVIVDE